MSRAISAAIDVDAPLERCWRVLRDTDRYPDWSPFLIRIEGKVEIGNPVTLVVQMKPGAAPIRQIETVTRDAPYELGWGMQMLHPALLSAERVQKLSPLDGGRTRYETTDVFAGALVPVVFSLYGRHIQRGFDETAAAFKRRAESSVG